MSRENVELVRRGYEVFVEGNVETAVQSILDPEIEWRTRENLPDSATYRGHDAVLGWFSTWLGAWEDFELEPEDFLGVGDFVVVSTRQRGRGVESGAYVEFRETHVWQLRDGRAVQVVEYADRAEALKAVGLAEEAEEVASHFAGANPATLGNGAKASRNATTFQVYGPPLRPALARGEASC